VSSLFTAPRPWIGDSIDRPLWTEDGLSKGFAKIARVEAVNEGYTGKLG